MHKFFFVVAVAVFALCVTDKASAQVVHHHQQVRSLYPSSDSCFYFVLDDVATPDPVASLRTENGSTIISPYFAVPSTHPNQKFMASVLLSALLSGKPVWVATTGQKACGEAAGVDYIIIHK